MGCLCWCLIVFPAEAQVSIEQVSLTKELEGFKTTAGATFKMETSQTVLLEMDLTPRIDYGWSDNLLFFVGNLGFSERGGETFRNQLFLHGQYRHQLTPTLAVETFFQTARDEFELLRRRYFGGVGLRWRVHREETTETFFGLTPSVGYERLNVTPEDNHPRTTTNVRLATYLVYRLKVNETTTLLNTVYVVPRVDDPEDVRVRDDAVLQVSITDRVALTATFSLKFDSRPPESLPEVVLALNNGLTVTF